MTNLKTNIEQKIALRKLFEQQTGIEWINTQGEPDIDYVNWLEDKVDLTNNMMKDVKELLDTLGQRKNCSCDFFGPSYSQELEIDKADAKLKSSIEKLERYIK